MLFFRVRGGYRGHDWFVHAQDDLTWREHPTTLHLYLVRHETRAYNRTEGQEPYMISWSVQYYPAIYVLQTLLSVGSAERQQSVCLIQPI